VSWVGGLVLGVLGVLLVVSLYAVHLVLTLERRPVRVPPTESGAVPSQHAWSRFHARWYLASMVFLAFDLEMLFMYPWAVVLPGMGVGAVVEMFGFLVVVMAAVVYAWREGAFRWT